MPTPHLWLLLRWALSLWVLGRIWLVIAASDRFQEVAELVSTAETRRKFA
ncbi:MULTISPECIES: hypothetical protein [unclassified Mesorhizobium]|nr:hypothetical protein [Mesorhizobium sp. LSHC420B00]ESX65298.1 hypothetical protein X759_29340 [Mesorhizobium sp. LSHC420B00]